MSSNPKTPDQIKRRLSEIRAEFRRLKGLNFIEHYADLAEEAQRLKAKLKEAQNEQP